MLTVDIRTPIKYAEEVVKKVKKKRNFCALPWKDTVVNWDGAVLPCCSVCEEKYSFGNAHRTALFSASSKCFSLDKSFWKNLFKKLVGVKMKLIPLRPANERVLLSEVFGK